MKEIILFLFFILSSYLSFAQQSFKIEGEITGFSTGKVFFIDMSNYQKMDTLAEGVIKDGKFLVKGTVPQLIAVNIRIENVANGPVLFLENADFKLNLFVEEGVTFANGIEVPVFFLGNELESKLEGGKAQKLANIYWENLQKLVIANENLQERLAIAGQNNDFETGKTLQGGRVQLKKRFDLQDDSLIKANQDSYVFAYMIAENMDDVYMGDEIIHKYNLLGQGDRETVYGKRIARRIIELSKIKPGLKAPDFILTDLNGNTKTLYESKVKVKMIHFWSPSCGPCIQEMPELTKIYREFHSGGLEWFGVIMGANLQMGKQLSDKLTLPWTGLLETKPEDSDMATLYSIKAWPTFIIVDQNNNILSTEDLSIMELREKLKRYLN